MGCCPTIFPCCLTMVSTLQRRVNASIIAPSAGLFSSCLSEADVSLLCPRIRVYPYEVLHELGHPDDDITFRPLASVCDEVMNVLGGDVPQQSPGYNVIN